MKTVFLFLGKSTFIGDVLKPEYLKYLSEHYRAVIFTSDLDSELAVSRGLYQSPNLIYKKWNLENYRLWALAKYARFHCIREFDNLATTYYFRRKRGALEKEEKNLLRIITRPLATIFSSSFFNKLELLLLKRSRQFEAYRDQYQPLAVLVGTPGLNNLDAEAVMLAKKYKLPCVSIASAWDNLTTRATRVRPTDYFFAWHEPMRQEAINIHRYPPARVLVTGALRFDEYFQNDKKLSGKKDFLLSKNLNPKYKTILYTTQKAHLFEENFIRRLIVYRDSGQIPYVNIMIRVHPLANKKRFSDFSSMKDVVVDRPSGDAMSKEDFLNLRNTLTYMDLNINYSSTISLEAILFDKPVINYFEPKLKSFELSHYKPLVDSGAVRLMRDQVGEITEAIKQYLEYPDTDREKREKVRNLYFPYRDGFSYKRSIDLLEKIINN